MADADVKEKVLEMLSAKLKMLSEKHQLVKLFRWNTCMKHGIPIDEVEEPLHLKVTYNQEEKQQQSAQIDEKISKLESIIKQNQEQLTQIKDRKVETDPSLDNKITSIEDQLKNNQQKLDEALKQKQELDPALVDKLLEFEGTLEDNKRKLDRALKQKTVEPTDEKFKLPPWAYGVIGSLLAILGTLGITNYFSGKEQAPPAQAPTIQIPTSEESLLQWLEDQGEHMP